MITAQITIYDAITGESVTRDFDADELTQLKLDKAEAKAKAEAEAEAEAAKASARVALLAKLGITEYEARLLQNISSL